MAKIPYFPFYPDDYLSSPGVTTCDLVDEGIYLRLLSYSWKHPGCQLPDDIEYLKRLCKNVREKRLRGVLEKFFVRIEAENGLYFWRNLRLFTEFCKHINISQSNSDAAKVRWNKGKQHASAIQPHMHSQSLPEPEPEPEEPLKPRGKTQNVRFTPPTVEEVKTYCGERKNSVDPEAFTSFYESKGWMIGKNKMKNWKFAVHTWEKNRDGGKADVNRKSFHERDVEQAEDARRKTRAFFGGRRSGAGLSSSPHKGEADTGRQGAIHGETCDLPDVEVVKN